MTRTSAETLQHQGQGCLPPHSFITALGAYYGTENSNTRDSEDFK